MKNSNIIILYNIVKQFAKLIHMKSTLDNTVSIFLNQIDDIRDKALIKLITQTGLYVDELRKVRLSDLNSSAIKINGKTNKLVSLSHETQLLLAEWVKKRPQCEHDNLFITLKGTPSILSKRGIDNIIRKWSNKTGISVNYRQLKQYYSDKEMHVYTHYDTEKSQNGRTKTEFSTQSICFTEKYKKVALIFAIFTALFALFKRFK